MVSTRGHWLALAFWALVVFTMVPFANDLQRWIHRQLGDQALFHGLVTALAVATATVVRWLSLHRRRQFWPCLLWILAISSSIGVWGWVLRDTAGAGHLAAFSILGVLAFRALRPGMTDTGVYLAATVLTAIVGTVDELLQWLTPGRYWDLADLGVNAGTAALIQVLIWQGIRPAGVNPGVSPRSRRIVARWLAVEVALVLACVSNTSERIAWYAERIPGLDYLGKERSTRMIDYGYLLVDPEIGRFRSRLDRQELARVDRVHGAESARVLRRYRRPGSHAELEKAYPPWRDPLIFEMREHLGVRNRERRKALDNLGGDDALAARHATAAMREQLILERYFGHTLDRFGDGLRPAARKQLENLQQADAGYESPVGQWLVTGFGEAAARRFLVAVLVALVVGDRLAAGKAAKSLP